MVKLIESHTSNKIIGKHILEVEAEYKHDSSFSKLQESFVFRDPT